MAFSEYLKRKTGSSCLAGSDVYNTNTLELPLAKRQTISINNETEKNVLFTPFE